MFSIKAPAPVTSRTVTASRLILLGGVALALAGCAKDKSELDETGGRQVVRSVCPAVAVPAYTETISLFSLPGTHDSRALDVTATITNFRTHCDDSGATVRSATTFDVVAQRANASGARDITLPYFSTVLRAGSTMMSKQIGQVQIHFADGQLRGKGVASASADVSKAMATLPSRISANLNRKRRATDADASVDPMSDPRVRTAVNQANFELLIGFQLTEDQLAYNASK
jgi:hypothetical protein